MPEILILVVSYSRIEFRDS